MVKQRERGLPSINQARQERKRALVFGKVRLGAMPPHFWLWAATIIAAILVVYWRVEQGKVESAKSAVMAKQRAIAVTLGPQIIPFRDKIEGWVKELADSEPKTFVRAGTSLEELSTQPSVYLRLRLEDAKTPKDIRKAAAQSLRDGFTSCLFVNKPQDPTSGPPCKTTADCSAGLLCNEWDVCVEPTSPFNMRLVYRALRVLSNEWTDELHNAGSTLEISAYDRDLVKVRDHDVPIAAKVLARSRYFALVLDEAPPEGLPEEIPDAGESVGERLQRAAHSARVGIWDLKTNELVLKLRAEASGKFVPVGKRNLDDPLINAAQQRQVNNCALALEVKAALDPSSVDMVDAAPAVP